MELRPDPSIFTPETTTENCFAGDSISGTDFWQRLTGVLYGYDYFVSYAHSDGSIYASALTARLREHNFECFLDLDTYSRGDNWKIVGAWALRRTTHLIVVGTPAALSSEPVLREVQIFTSSGRKVVPIDFDGCLANAKPEMALVRDHLNEAVLHVSEVMERLAHGPSEDAVREIVTSFRATRANLKRVRFLKLLAVVLVSMLVITVVQLRRVVEKERVANQRLSTVNWQLARASRRQSVAAAELSPVKASLFYFAAARSGESAGDFRTARNAILAGTLAGPIVLHSVHFETPIVGAVFRKDGKAFAAWNELETAWIRETETGVLVMGPIPLSQVPSEQFPEIKKPESLVDRFSTTSPDRRWIAKWTTNSVQVWSTITGRPQGTPVEADRVLGGVFSSDGNRFLAWTMIDGILMDLTNRLSAPKAFRSSFLISNGEFSPDGSLIMLSSTLGKAQIWDALDGYEFLRAIQHLGWNGDVVDGDTRISFGARPNQVFSVESGGAAVAWTVRRFDPPDGRWLNHGTPILGGSINPTGNRALTYDRDGIVRIWNLASDGDQTISPSGCIALALSATGEFFLSNAQGDQPARLFRLGDSSPTSRELPYDREISEARFNADGSRLFTLQKDGTLQLWNSHDGTAIGGAIPEANSYAFDLDFRWFLTADDDGNIVFWDTSGPPVAVSKVATLSDLFAVAPGGDRFACVSTDEVLRQRNTRDGNALGGAVQLEGLPDGLLYDPTGRRVLILEEDGTIRFWDTAEPKLDNASLRCEPGIRGIRFSPDGERMLIWTASGTARVWHIRDRNFIAVVRHDDEITDAQFSSDGEWILTGGHDGFVRLWNAKGGDLLASFQAGDLVGSVAFTKGNRSIVAHCIEGAVLKWSIDAAGDVPVDIRAADLELRSGIFLDDGGHVHPLNGPQSEERRRVIRKWEKRSGIKASANTTVQTTKQN